MNWYPRYTGDYSRDTAHLTMTEHGAFNLMLDYYYATENPLPECINQIHRITGAFTADEQSAVQAVLKQYFKHTPGIGYRNNKADAVIKEQNEKRAKAVTKATKAAEDRWSRIKDATSNATSIPQAMHKQCHPEPEPEPEVRVQKQKAIAPGEPDAGKTRKQNLEFNALAELDGGASNITPSAAGRVAKALQGIKSVSPNVTADEIKRRERNYKTWFDGAVCTSTALSAHWAKCDKRKLNAAAIEQQMRVTIRD